MSSEYRSQEAAARAKIDALEIELREREAKLATLLFSRSPGVRMPPPIRFPTAPDRPQHEVELNIIFAVAIGGACFWIGVPPGWAFVAGSAAYLVFWRIAATRRANAAREIGRPAKAADEIAALAAQVTDRNAQIETFDLQVAAERKACADLRTRIAELEAIAVDDSIKNRESSR